MKPNALPREPKFEPQEHADVLRVLRVAAGYLAERKSDERPGGRTAMLCTAVDLAVRKLDTQAAVDVADKIKLLFKARLAKAATVRQWLVDRGYPAGSNEAAVYEKVQDVRRRWLVALMKEFLHEQTGAKTRVRDRKRSARADRRSRGVARPIHRDDDRQ